MRCATVPVRHPAPLVPDDALEAWVDRHRCRVPSEALDVGLFVVELDRPWHDTPFLLQGFTIDSPDELQALRANCSFAYVDLDRSNPAAVHALRVRITERSARPTPTQDLPRTLAPRADLRISATTRQRFRQFAGPREAPIGRGVLARIRSLVGRPLASAAMARHADPGIARHARRGLLPSDLQATPHPVARSFDDELPRARRAFAFGEEALRGLLDALRAGRTAELTTITTAAYALTDSLIDNPHALLWIGRTRDADFNAANHGVKVAVYLVALARHLGLPRRQMAELAMVGLLADIGKVHVPQALLDKPGMLAADEFAQVKLHVRYSLDAVSACADLPDGVELGIGQHHERLDGSGYPGGLKGDEISLYGRMAAIADSFAALITPRAYAAAASPQDALMNLCEWAGSSFDEPLVEQFVQTVGMFPVGSLVELSSGEVARVVTLPVARLQRTRVLVLTEADKAPLERPREVEAIGTHESGGAVGPSQAACVRIVAGLPSGSHGLAVNDPYAQGRVEPLNARG